MSTITYENQKGGTHWGITVRLDGKWVGSIRRYPDGYCYKPKGTRKPGEFFPSIEAVKRSLEAA